LVLSLAILLVLSSCASFLEEQQPMMENKIYKIKLDRTES
jgi:cathepsin D